MIPLGAPPSWVLPWLAPTTILALLAAIGAWIKTRRDVRDKAVAEAAAAWKGLVDELQERVESLHKEIVACEAERKVDRDEIRSLNARVRELEEQMALRRVVRRASREREADHGR